MALMSSTGRAEITKRLITEKGFVAVAVEADWPDAYRVNRYVRGINDDATARDALAGFKRFPIWMWRNTDVLDFIEWLRTHNTGLPHGDEAKIPAGGQSLIPLLRFRLAAPSLLIDIIRLSELEYIREADGALHIGALTREAALETSSLVHHRYPILRDTSKGVADPVVRNWGTVGGNLAHADPANDHPATMLALGARVVAEGPDGKRVIPIDAFFTDSPFVTTLQPNEILTEIRIPAPTERSGGAYFKLERKVGDYAIAGVAASLTLDPDGLVTYAGIGLTNVGPSPIKARNAEQALHGKPLDDAHIHQAADLAAAASQPGSDRRGTAEYRRAMVRTLCVRALRKALARATEGEEL